MDPQATAGRIVHYTASKGQKRAAIVMADTPPDGTAAITVFADTGPAPLFGVPHASIEGVVGHWNWMPYQKEKAKTARGNVSESAVDREADSPDDGKAGDVALPPGSVGPDDEAGDGPPDKSPDIRLDPADPVGQPASGAEEAGEEGRPRSDGLVRHLAQRHLRLRAGCLQAERLAHRRDALRRDLP